MSWIDSANEYLASYYLKFRMRFDKTGKLLIKPAPSLTVSKAQNHLRLRPVSDCKSTENHTT
jgi:hypothetical protein